MGKTVVILMGLQGSGKSTFYRTYLSEDFVRVNLDTLKTRYQEKLLIEECLNLQKSFAVDPACNMLHGLCSSCRCFPSE